MNDWSNNSKVTVNRRELLKLGLISGSSFILPVTGCAKADTTTGVRSGDDLFVNGHLLITESNELVLLLDRVEMGQGIERAFARIVASELNISTADIVVRSANIGQHQNPLLSPPWGTGGSESIRWAWKGLREASAQLREIFLQAAAIKNKVTPGDCIFEGLSIRQTHKNKVNSLASLIPIASTLPIPTVTLAEAAAPAPDVGDKHAYFYARSSAQLRFGLDIELPELLTAIILKPPGPGAELRNYTVKNTAAVPPSISLLQIEQSLVVVASSYREAQKAAQAIAPEWHIPYPRLSTETVYQNLQSQLEQQWEQVAGELKDGANETVIERDFRVPYLAHLCMEPMNCTVWYQHDHCDVWAPTQRPSTALRAVQEITGLSPEQINLQVPALGGGFGQRLGIGYVREATMVSMQLKKPVKLVYPRQSDIRGDTFRPAVVARSRAEFDDRGQLQRWQQQVVSSEQAYSPQESISRKVIRWSKQGLKRLLNEGPSPETFNHYAIPKTELPQLNIGEVVATGPWRSVENSYLAFFHESFIDEIAEQLDQSPYEYRKTLTANNPRLHKVTERLGEVSGACTSVNTSRNIGFALFQGYGSYCGLAIEVAGTAGKITISKAWIVADVGTVIDRSGLLAQLEGGFLYGLCAALYGEVSIKNGKYTQSNFHDYPVLRIIETPVLEIEIIDSNEAPGGAGELATPLAAPALANALYTVTGQRISCLPIKL